jgi:hypothetical protein
LLSFSAAAALSCDSRCRACLMNGVNSQPEDDVAPLFLYASALCCALRGCVTQSVVQFRCPMCLRKLHHCLRFNPCSATRICRWIVVHWRHPRAPSHTACCCVLLCSLLVQAAYARAGLTEQAAWMERRLARVKARIASAAVSAAGPESAGAASSSEAAASDCAAAGAGGGATAAAGAGAVEAKTVAAAGVS